VAPHKDVDRKRVTLVYRPHDPASATKAVENDRKDATFAALGRKVGRARDVLSVRAAEQSATEEATGAGVVRFGVLVTATVLDPARLPLAVAAVTGLGTMSRMQLRRVYGAQAAAFSAALPLGLVLPAHLRVPQSRSRLELMTVTGTMQPAKRMPGPRGLPGRGGGRVAYVEAAPEWRGTTVQVCGIYPFGVGSGTPMIGVPLGRSILTQAAVCCDPISWFWRAHLIANPSCLLLGKPGLGKSSVVRRMVLGLAGYGVLPVVFGDLKPDYVDLIVALGGHVISLGRGQGTLNVLDPGAAGAAAQRLTGAARKRLLADVHGRRLTLVAALVGLNRQGLVGDQEEAVLSAALGLLDARHKPGEAVLSDLIKVIAEGPEAVRSATVDRGDLDRYHNAVDPLHRSLLALCGGAMGDTFAHRTTVPVSLDGPLCIDISAINEADEKLQAAVLLACWGEGFAAISAAQALADAGLEPQRQFFVVLDELWRVLRAGRGLVDRVDSLTRLNRQHGVGMAMVTHTLGDMLSLADAADRAKARGFAERAGFLVCGGLPAAEMEPLQKIVGMSEREQALVTSWSTPPAWSTEGGREMAPPGRGHFLIKVGGRPGIPVNVALTADELGLHDTNKRWRAK